jgi:hypothetical protein
MAFSQGLLYFVLIILSPLFLASVYMNAYLPFINTVKGLKLEIKTSDGEEREYWKKELRLLYIRNIPFMGEFIYRKYIDKNN